MQFPVEAASALFQYLLEFYERRYPNIRDQLLQGAIAEIERHLKEHERYQGDLRNAPPEVRLLEVFLHMRFLADYWHWSHLPGGAQHQYPPEIVSLLLAAKDHITAAWDLPLGLS